MIPNPPLAIPSTPHAKRAPTRRTALTWLDDPELWQAFSRPNRADPTLCEASIIIDGMHCAACAITIEERLRRIPGMVAVRVGAASHRAQLLWSAAQLSPSTWMQTIETLGYHAVPANDVLAKERRRLESRQALWRCLVAGLCMMQV